MIALGMRNFYKYIKVTELGGCWEWTGALTHNGYGDYSHARNFGYSGRAHRIMWEIANGPIPEGMMVLHKCDNRKCVKASHLFLGTAADNTKDMQRKGRAPVGEKQGGAKLSDQDTSWIRYWLSRGYGQKDIARTFGVTQSTISRISTGDIRSAV